MLRRIFTKTDAKFLREVLQNPVSDNPKLLKWESQGLLRRVYSYDRSHYGGNFNAPVYVFTFTELGAEAWADALGDA